MNILVMLVSVLVSFSVLTNFVVQREPIEERYIERLDPSEPVDYFDLAETILGSESAPEQHSLAFNLFARAAYWGSFHNDPQLAASACIAMASLVTKPQDQQWLWNCALLLDPEREAEWVRFFTKPHAVREQIEKAAAACLYAIRFHEHPEAMELYGAPGVKNEILEAGERAGVPRLELLRVLERELERGAQDPCGGRMYIADRSNPGLRIVCPDHLRGLGMCANDEELRVFLKLEMVLNGVRAESWSSGEFISADRVIKLPRVEDLRVKFDVDPAKAFYRDGRWVTSP